jgi:hypothetical protein
MMGVDKSDENSMSGKAGRDESDSDLADRVLLQRHASLLLHAMVTQVFFRTLNVFLMVSAIAHPFAAESWVVTASWIVLAIFLALLWQWDRQLLRSRINGIERALGKVNEYEFARRYIAYSFEATSTPRSVVYRFEPGFWVLLIAAATLAANVSWAWVAAK